MRIAWSADAPTAAHKCVLVAMAWHADPESGAIRPSLTTIAHMSSLSRDRVRVVVGELVRLGRLEVVEERPGRETVYRMGRPAQSAQPSRVGKEGTPRARKEGSANAPSLPASRTPLADKETPPLPASVTPLADKGRTEEQVSERAAGAAAGSDDPVSEMRRLSAQMRPSLDFATVHTKFVAYWRERDAPRQHSVEAFERWLMQEREGVRHASEASRPVSKPVMVTDIPSLRPRTPEEMTAASEAAAQQMPRLLALRDQLAGKVGR